MANNNIYHHNASSSFSLTEPDDISVFLRHILHPSSNFVTHEMQYSSSLPHLLPKNQHGLDISNGELSSVLNSSAGGIFSSSYGAYNVPANVSSSSVGTMDNEPDEYECESEVFLHTSYLVFHKFTNLLSSQSGVLKSFLYPSRAEVYRK